MVQSYKRLDIKAQVDQN